METLEERIRRVVAEEVEVVPYEPRWTLLYENEKAHLLACLPAGLIERVEHFGSTAVPGLCAKPVIDILVGVASLEEAKEAAPPILEAQGYDYFWRPIGNVDQPPYYAWFIKRGPRGERTHHIHMVEAHFEHWDRLRFRDWLRTHPDDAKAYGDLKLRLAKEHPKDRIAYTEAKGAFIREITAKAATWP